MPDQQLVAGKSVVGLVGNGQVLHWKCRALGLVKRRDEMRGGRDGWDTFTPLLSSEKVPDCNMGETHSPGLHEGGVQEFCQGARLTLETSN